MSRDITKEYTNGDLAVVWKPGKCIHSGICVSMLPKVYHPDQKPWINAKNASPEELKAQISQCPSGALSYYIGKKSETKNQKVMKTDIKVMPNGPIILNGKVEITDQKGKKISSEEMTAFCRCGASANKPFCDGSHQKINFKDE